WRYQVAPVAGSRRYGVDRGAPGGRVPPRPQRLHPFDLSPLDARIDAERVAWRRASLFIEFVGADDDRLAGIDGLLRAVGRFLNLALDQSRLDGGERASGRLDPVENCHGLAFDAVGRRFDRVGPGDGIDRIGDAGLRGNDLLRAQGDSRRLLGRQRQRLVAAVAVQRLGTAEDGRERLQCDADNIVV